MQIPFIRVYPNGRKGLQEVVRGSKVEAMAVEFIARGGRYMSTINANLEVELIAAVKGPDGFVEMAKETVPSAEDTSMLSAVDRLVETSLANLNGVDA